MVKCTLCTVESPNERANEFHLKKRHSRPLPEDATEKQIIVMGSPFTVLFTNGEYRCSSCNTQGNINCITFHIRDRHLISAKERSAQKKEEKWLIKRENTHLCTICWEVVRKDHLAAHNSGYFHKRKARYVEGSGCDICRMHRNEYFHPMDRHIQGTYHHSMARTVDYVYGTGCDVCRVSREECKSGMHGRIQWYSNKIQPDKYREGDGCDVCKISYKQFAATHEDTVKHQKKMETVEYLTFKYLQKPKKSAKSAQYSQ